MTVGEIGEEAFSNCIGLEEIEFTPISINIFNGAFKYCHALKELRFLDKWLFIGDSAFIGCDNIERIYSIVPDPGKIKLETFSYDAYENCMLYVQEESLDTYLEKEYWNRFKNILVYDFNAVDQVEIDSPDVEIFNLNGVRMNNDLQNLRHGCYILKKGRKTIKVSI